jgi:hypothetical protein
MPDLHWHIGDDAEQQTAATTTRARRSRRSWLAILIVAVIGAGLGALYRSIPELAQRPTSTPGPAPSPTRPAIPAALYQTIEREVQALADGDKETFLALQGRSSDQLFNSFSAWGRPTDQRPLYTIIDFELQTPITAWMDIRQFRSGRSFRETRFYVFEKDRWLRSDPVLPFWSGQTETLNTPHFHVIYAVEDRDLIQPVIDQLEQVHERICIDLDCGTTPLTYTLNLNGSVNRDWHIFDNGREIDFVSPRVMGLYEDAPALGEKGQSLRWALVRASVQQSAVVARNSFPLVRAISDWAAMRAIDWPAPQWASGVKAYIQGSFSSWEDLWGEISDEGSYHLAYSFIHFIEQEYGASAVTKILKSVHTAQSFRDLVEKSLGVPFAEFEQKWQMWAKQNIPGQ